ncbi:MAG: homocitrate synthase family protein [Halobacteriota archaeon]|nr:homocitrate synthase family protein [Halobacteriota archaeon]
MNFERYHIINQKRLEDIEICDVTLRDGEQTPGVSFIAEEKIEIACKLDEIGVEIIEAGFPIVSKDEARTVREIANLGLNARTCALARANPPDIECVASCDIDIVALVFGTSDIHLRFKYKATREEAIKRAVSALDCAKDYGLTVRFAAEDATRSDINFLKEYFAAGEKHGADMLSIADTVGVLNPKSTHFLVDEINKASNLPICIHCHDDLGMSLANTLAGAEAGVKQLQATVNGLGERSGNTPLEELLVALYLQYGVDRYDLSKICELSDMVERYSGIPVAKNKAVVGAHAFTHESGIHVAAVLKDPNTYEPFLPELVGGERRFVLGKHTGRRSLQHILEQEGYELSDEELSITLEKIKEEATSSSPISQREVGELIIKIKQP